MHLGRDLGRPLARPVLRNQIFHDASELGRVWSRLCSSFSLSNHHQNNNLAMGSNSRSMADLARQLVLALQPDLGEGSSQLETTTRHVVSELKANAHGGLRTEWEDVRGTFHGWVLEGYSVADHKAFEVCSYMCRGRCGGRVRQARGQARAPSTKRGHDLGRQHALTHDQHSPAYPAPGQFSLHKIKLTLQLALSGPIVPKTRELAQEYLTRPPQVPKSDLRLYEEIMAEPFEGDHWGPGYDEEVMEGWTESEDSEGNTTATEEEVVTPALKTPRYRSAAADAAREAELRRRAEEEQRLLFAKLSLRDLGANAYWKSGGCDVPIRDDLHGWRALSSGRLSRRRR